MTPQLRAPPADQGCPLQVVYYVFAIIGMEAFHGKVRFFDQNFTTPDALMCGNPALKDSAFARDRYCKNNFNDLASSFIVLMELTVVNQWHNILSMKAWEPPPPTPGCLLAGLGWEGEAPGGTSRSTPGTLPSSPKAGFLSCALLADGFALVTHQAARLYFISFHVVVVILIIK